MSDTYRGFIVVLEEDVNEGGSKQLVNVLKSLKGVAAVTAITLDPQATISDARARMKVRDKLIALYEDFK